MSAAPSEYGRQRRRVRNTELAGSATAGAVGSSFGAAKLRDAFKEEHPASFQRGLAHVNNAANRARATPRTATKILRMADSGKPGFAPLATAAAAGAIAAGANRYGEVLDLRHRRRERRIAMSKSDPGAVLGRLPRYVVHDGRRKRVLGMHDKDNFRVLDPDDSVRIVHRSKVRFARPAKGTAMSKSVNGFGIDDVTLTKSFRSAAARSRGAAAAHRMIAGKYEAAGTSAVPHGMGPRPSSADMLRTGRLNEVRGSNAGNARFHRDKGAVLDVQASNATRRGRKLRIAAVGATGAAGAGSLATRRHESVAKSGFGIGHGPDGDIHKSGRLRDAARRPTTQNTRGDNVKVGTAVGAAEGGAFFGGIGAASGAAHARQGVKTLRMAVPAAAPGRLAATRIATRTAVRTGSRTGLAGAALFAPVGAFAGATSPARKRRKVSKSAFGVEHELDKAFDPERQRHRRQVGYESAAAGGAAVSAAPVPGAARRALRLRRQASREMGEEVSSHADVQGSLNRMAQPNGTPKTGQNISSAARVHREALGHRREGMKLAHEAKTASRVARGGALGAAGLAAAAVTVHRHDRRGGRTYGYR